MPSLLLATFQGEPVNLGSFGTSAAVIYIYPGSKGGPDGGEDTPRLDAIEHRAFDAHGPDLRALDLLVLGLSSELLEDQLESTTATGIEHVLLSDPHLLLAEKLELPFFEDGGRRWYRRLTLIVRSGRVKKVFFPVPHPARNPAQVGAWAKVHSR
jgi:peroxiredoxin